MAICFVHLPKHANKHKISTLNPINLKPSYEQVTNATIPYPRLYTISNYNMFSIPKSYTNSRKIPTLHTDNRQFTAAKFVQKQEFEHNL